MESPQSSIISLYKIKNPFGFQIFITSGDSTNVFTIHRMNNLKTFKAALNNFIYDKTNPKRKRALVSKSITKIENNADLKKKCLDHQYCLIAFVNARNVEEEIEKFDKTMMLLETYTRNPSFDKIKFNWIDVSCHRHLFEKLKGQDVPGLFFFYNWRDTYTIFKGLWEQFIVGDYIERNLADRIDGIDTPKKELIIESECVATEGSEDAKAEISKTVEETKISDDNLSVETIKKTDL
jgi:hypothetical protein